MKEARDHEEKPVEWAITKFTNILKRTLTEEEESAVRFLHKNKPLRSAMADVYQDLGELKRRIQEIINELANEKKSENKEKSIELVLSIFTEALGRNLTKEEKEVIRFLCFLNIKRILKRLGNLLKVSLTVYRHKDSDDNKQSQSDPVEVIRAAYPKAIGRDLTKMEVSLAVQFYDLYKNGQLPLALHGVYHVLPKNAMTKALDDEFLERS